MSLALLWFCSFTLLQGCGTSAEHSGTQSEARASIPVKDTMRIHFERSGGFAGLQLAVTIESDTLSQEDLQQLRWLVDEADFFALPSELREQTPRADQFVYKVTVESAGRRHTVETTDEAAPPTLQPLLDWLSRAVRTARRRS
ncbi:MAG: hypothetical protein OEO20_07445 [Gemmatimonadota bacterium]|nr:hypothetical protein [Gemmatimonadota bacterium]MDH3367238.1 hypothetical protein [Gemmatimonadota bacterium]MDH3478123.1 hypothetical protein [Gemmatimonadota bacterium]MDH3570169.1 hypothetical protein [Gemmatimonadota bacterium]MDH5550500.1 hypothetical protein [Gemmatimonadota bacterium]